MTLHAAKGLEFDVVFLTGMEESVFPHSRALREEAGGEDPEEMAEERRLAYVGITRARRRLFFTLARARTLFGEFKQNAPSRFLADVPRELFGFDLPSRASEGPPGPPARPGAAGEPYVELDDSDGFTVDVEFDQRPPHERRRGPSAYSPPLPGQGRITAGMRVRHANLGEGVVVDSSDRSRDPKLTVRFQGVGEKRVLARFLTPLS
jgi:DNA helicase-2/ATP-dependent DNA helicase PcrA